MRKDFNLASCCSWLLGIALTFFIGTLSFGIGKNERWSVALDQSCFMLSSNSANPIFIVINNPKRVERHVDVHLDFKDPQGNTIYLWATGLAAPSGTSMHILFLDSDAVFLLKQNAGSKVDIVLIGDKSQSLAQLSTVVGYDFDSIISVDPTSGAVPLEVNFTCVASGGIPPYKYDWDFGAGFSNEPNFQQVYTVPGLYNVVCVATDSANAVSIKKLQIDTR